MKQMIQKNKINKNFQGFSLAIRRCHDGDGNKNVKKAMPRVSDFFIYCTSLPPLHDHNVKLPNLD